MDSRIGLDYIVENRDYISKLGAALDTNNAIVKKQVFELLSALCAYNAEGYARAIETLEFYKNLKKERYRFKIVINELEKATNIEYQVALLAFINCVIISATNLQERIRIRNEFIGLKALPVLNNLRKVAQSVGDIIVQLDVFEEQRECDEAQSLQAPDGINLSSHLDVFYAILRQVADTPQEVPFLSILQHLLRIDPKEPVSDIIWDTTEKLVHRATLLENHEDSVRLLRTPSVQKFSCPHCRHDATSPSRKASGVPPQTSSASQQQHNGPLSPAAATAISAPLPPPPPTSTVASKNKSNAAPPPPPPLPPTTATATFTVNGAPLPPPPPPPMVISNGIGPPVPPPIPFPPPAPNNLRTNNANSARPLTPEPNGLLLGDQSAILLPQQDTPAPKSKMKTLNWGKIPPNKVIGKQNIWTIVASNHQHSPMADIDWNEMEGLFCLQSTSAQGSPKLGRDSNGSSGYDTLDRKSKKETTEITLLDGKRSLNVNIFLKQFRTSNDDIIQLIKNGEHDDIGAEKLRGLLKILPEVDELDMLKTFNGDKSRLGNAEKFLLQLMQVPNYKLRIESMVLKEEFAANVSYLDPCINAMLYAGDDLINNKTLQEVLYMVVVAGNFLNSGGYAGNAVGVKLTSLQKLTDIRANKPGMNLIHFVALQAEKRNPELLKFTTQLTALENAAKTTSEQINNEINTLDSRIKKIKRQIEQPATDEDIKEQMLDFLLRAESEVDVLKAGMKEVEAMRLKLADFFCDDPTTFRLEECFKIFQNFCDKFKQAVKENERRQQLEEQATLRRKQREEQLARKARQMSQAGTPVSDSDSHQFLMDPSFHDPRASPALSRRRMGSFNSGCDINGSNSFIRMESNDGMSPDITPNGSLRRRRSRILAEENDLMEFLRTSAGQEHASRERKAYGSLDRSWARRARSGSSSRKRPDLLNIDFGAERERASSPVPILQQDKQQSPLAAQPTVSLATSATSASQVHAANEDAKPRISREWRQKIETWLQSNESDEKQNEEYKRKRRLVNMNRRSIENDTENERKLDTLPEEKIMPTTPVPSTNNTNGSNNETNNSNSYQRVYPDWKPSKTLEQTDIVGNIQAIADINNAISKSHTNKINHTSSTIIGETNHNNNNNATVNNNEVNHLTTAEELRQYRRQRSQENNEKHALQSIAEEDRRKSFIQKLGERDAKDRLQIYIRRPSSMEITEPKELKSKTIIDTQSTPAVATGAEIPLNRTASNAKVNADNPKSPKTAALCKSNSNTFEYEDTTMPKTQDNTFAHLLDHHKSHNESPQYSRKEIDADNIETPPVTRRIIASPNGTTVMVSVTNDRPVTTPISTTTDKDKCAEIEPGHFDRHSIARRTRRYKRPTDYSSGTEELTSSHESTKTNNLLRQSASANEVRRSLQHKPTEEKSKVEKQNATTKEKTITKLEKVGRHISSINQEDVREAIRNLKSPTGTPERIWSPPREISNPIVTTLKVSTNTHTHSNHHHELNDEGFEETQSLVSDTPSHGKEESTNSSCNEANELPPVQLSKTIKNKQAASKQPSISNRLADRLQISRLRSVSQPQREVTLKSQNQNSNHVPTTTKRSTSQVERSRSVRLPNGQLLHTPDTTHTRSSSSSMRRSLETTPQSSPTHVVNTVNGRRDVERSSSRNSLRSSRSSINSGASTNTVVRRMPPSTVIVNKSPLHTASVDSSPSKRPLSAQNRGIYGRTSTGGVPASRSSSSGSSVGHNVVVIRKTSSGSSRAASNGLASTSFKENQTHGSNSTSRANLARSAVLVKAAMLPNSATTASASGRNITKSSSAGSSSRAVSSFMRPTASSATKRNK